MADEPMKLIPLAPQEQAQIEEELEEENELEWEEEVLLRITAIHQIVSAIYVYLQKSGRADNSPPATE
jgi:hypothetical protein